MALVPDATAHLALSPVFTLWGSSGHFVLVDLPLTTSQSLSASTLPPSAVFEAAKRALASREAEPAESLIEVTASLQVDEFRETAASLGPIFRFSHAVHFLVYSGPPGRRSERKVLRTQALAFTNEPGSRFADAFPLWMGFEGVQASPAASLPPALEALCSPMTGRGLG